MLGCLTGLKVCGKNHAQVKKDVEMWYDVTFILKSGLSEEK